MTTEPRYRVTAEMVTVTAVGGVLAGRNGRMAYNLEAGRFLPPGVLEHQVRHLLDNNMIEVVDPAPSTGADRPIG